MCLTVNESFKSSYAARKYSKKPLVAEQDILVYKILRKITNKTPHQLYTFKQGYVHYRFGPQKFKFNFGKKHVYYPKPNPGLRAEMKYIIEVRDGLHAYQNKAEATIRLWRSRTVIHKMIIPKGSEYFIGDNGDIVATKLWWPEANDSVFETARTIKQIIANKNKIKK
jgi:hypothetical protein